jgi:hypothetical protein
MVVPICVIFYLLITVPTCSSGQPRHADSKSMVPKGWPAVPLTALQLHLHGEVTFESTPLQEQVWQREGHQPTQRDIGYHLFGVVRAD